jgi:2-methylcitrate dehydratase
VAAGVSKAFGSNQTHTANAIAIAGTASNALRVTRTGSLSHWKGLASANAAFGATHAAFLARRGITGPPEVFEGNKGFMEAIAGRFEIDWSKEDLEQVTRTVVKKYNAELHAQSVLEAALELKHEHQVAGADLERVELEVFDVAHAIIGGGEEGDKTLVRTKEQADHSLPYMAAAAILDDQVMPEQYLPERIQRTDVQHLLQKVVVRVSRAYSQAFPNAMPCRVTFHLRGGLTLSKEKRDYEGFHTRPMTWETVARKFERLSAAFVDAALRKKILNAVSRLEAIQAASLTGLLAQVRAVRT